MDRKGKLSVPEILRGVASAVGCAIAGAAILTTLVSGEVIAQRDIWVWCLLVHLAAAVSGSLVCVWQAKEFANIPATAGIYYALAVGGGLLFNAEANAVLPTLAVVALGGGIAWILCARRNSGGVRRHKKRRYR